MKDIKLKVLHIHNFRDITDKTYDLTKSNHIEIAGKNHRGKSNSLEAYVWLMTGSLLRGASETKSIGIISKDDETAHVIVDALFQIDDSEFVVKKEFYNKFKMIDGEKILDGTTTEYSSGKPNGLVKHKTQRDALAEIASAFGYDEINDKLVTPTLKSNIASFLINPKWCIETLDSIELRKLLMSLCDGERYTNDELIKNHPEVESILTDYESNNRDSNRLKQAIATQIKDASITKKEIEGAIKALSQIKDVDSTELIKAKNQIDSNNQAIYDLQNKKEAEDPRVSILNKSRQELSEKMSQVSQTSHENYNKLNNEYQISILDIAESKNKALQDLNSASSNKSYAVNTLNNAKRDVDYLNAQIESKEKDRVVLLEAYHKEKQKEFKFNGQTIVCPNCQKEIEIGLDEMKASFETEKQSNIDNYISKGKTVKLDIDNLKIKLENARKSLVDLEANVDLTTKEHELKQHAFQVISDELDEKRKEFKVYIAPKEIDDIKAKINEIDNQIYQIKNESKSSSKSDTILNLKSQIYQLQQIVDAHIHFEKTKDDITASNVKLDKINSYICSLEQKRALCQMLQQAESEITNERLKTIIPDVKFVLFERSMKDGKMNNDICIPQVESGAKYTNASTSEKIICAIKVQKGIANALGLSDMPIAIDEGETLDEDTLLPTDTQALISCVDNRFNAPTLIDFNSKKEVC